MVRQCQVCKKLDYRNPNLSFHSFPSNIIRKRIWFSLLCFDGDAILPKRPEICSDHFDKSDFQYKRNGLKYLKPNVNPKPLHPEIFELEPFSSDSTVETPSRREVFSTPLSFTSSYTEKSNENQEVAINQDLNVKGVISPQEIEEVLQPSTSKYTQQVLYKKRETNKLSSTESSTMTTSETEKQMIGGSKVAQKDTSLSTVTESKGKLSLVILPEKRQRRYVGNMSIDEFSSPKNRTRNFKVIKSTMIKQRHRIKTLICTVRRLKSRINILNFLLKELKEKALITKSSENTL